MWSGVSIDIPITLAVVLGGKIFGWKVPTSGNFDP